MKKALSFILIFLITGLFLTGSEYRYSADLTTYSTGKVHVEVEFSSEQPQVRMNLNIFRGLREFLQKVKNLKAIDEQGNSINIINMGTYFIIQSQKGKLSYDVDLNYNPSFYANIYDLPLLKANASMLGGYMLFALPDEKAEIKVKFLLPEGTKIFTPWKLLEDGFYAIPSVESLWKDVFLLGNYKIHEQKAGEFALYTAIHPDVSASSLQNLTNFHKLTLESFKYLKDAFGLPFADKISSLTFIINPVNVAGKHPAYYGGSMHHSTAVFQIGPQRKLLDINFLAFFTKQMIQLWTRVALKGDEKKWLGFAPDILWFQEGIENAFRILALRRAKALTDELLTTNFRTIYSSYRKNELKTVQAFQDAAMAYYDDREARKLVRDKSPLVILLLEEEIRKATADRKGVADLVKILVEKFSFIKQKVTLTNEVILQALQELTGKDFTDFFNKYVKGTEEIKLGPIGGYSLLTKNK